MSPLALSLCFLQSQPDSRLVELAREGHEPAFEALVRRYRKELLGYCRRLQPHSGGAEDALQQALLQAWTALKAGAEVRAVRPWLYRIAHNVSLNQLRVGVAVPQQPQEAAGGQEVDQLVEQRLAARAALAEVASLPTLQRDVFVSTALNGASHEQVARALGLSSGAVRGLIYRARAALRAAAAAFTPGPTLHWVIRRLEPQLPGARATAEALAGGGGAGVATAIAKGGVVLTLAGAVAGAGGGILGPAGGHHRHQHTRLIRPANGSASPARLEGDRVAASARATELGRGVLADGSRGAGRAHEPRSGPADALRRDASSGPTGRGGRRGSQSDGSRNGSDGGPSSGSTAASGSSDGGSSAGEITASSGSGGSPGGPGPSSGRSDGGSSGSGATSTSPSSGSGGGARASASGSTTGEPVTTVKATSDGGSSGSTSGTSGASSPGLVETTTTTTTSGSH